MLTRGSTMLKLLRGNPIGLIGLAIVMLVIVVAIVAPLISPFAPTVQLGRRLLLPNGRFLLGTDEFGRDILSRIIYGTRISLYVGAISVGLALLIGGTIGLVSGFFGGMLDNVLMRL